MKSFLKEIESKFREINECECESVHPGLTHEAYLQEQEHDRDGDGDEDSDDYMISKDRAIKAAMKKENAKPDFLDLDGDGDTEEDMKDAARESIKTSDPKVAMDIQKKDPTVDIELIEDDLEEASLSGAAGAYMTPNAFAKPGQKKKKYKWSSVSEAMDHKYEKLIESYSKFATGNPKSTPSQTVNGTIKEVAKKLQEIEQLVKYTSRLKNESGIAGSTYKKSTHNALNRISERLLKISERVRSLGE